MGTFLVALAAVLSFVCVALYAVNDNAALAALAAMWAFTTAMWCLTLGVRLGSRR